MNNFCVITTINKPTHAVKDLHDKFGDKLIIVGDKKTPEDWEYKDALYLPESLQNKLSYLSTFHDNHYARKNVGYLQAIAKGATLIYDTDDDIIPNKNWKKRTLEVIADDSQTEGWFNVYNLFTNKGIWPRGFSLKEVNKSTFEIKNQKQRISSIQQGLSDGEPDVDAIWRLILKRTQHFWVNKSVYLQPYTWCPFNSQSSWWFPKAYPLLYLPVTASFRMTDIWRSFIAQRCLWAIGEGVTFHSPSEGFQERNEHDLLKDFEDEIPGYLKNDLIVEILQNLELKKGEENMCENLMTCYQELCAKDILPSMEINSVKAWIKDYENVTRVV